MSQPKILAFAGSTRTGSFNKKLVAIAAEAARAAGAAVTIVDLRDLALPVFDEDLEAAGGLPEGAKKFKALLRESDGFLVASRTTSFRVKFLYVPSRNLRFISEALFIAIRNGLEGESHG